MPKQSLLPRPGQKLRSITWTAAGLKNPQADFSTMHAFAYPDCVHVCNLHLQTRRANDKTSGRETKGTHGCCISSCSSSSSGIRGWVVPIQCRY